jgi:hypothetical protein
MAVILFKDGGFKICNEYSFLHELDAGWSLTKEPPKSEEQIEEEIVEETTEDAETEEETEANEPEDAEPVLVLDDEAAEDELIAGFTVDEIRAMAKDAGIGNWHNKKIENLLKELEGLTDG